MNIFKVLAISAFIFLSACSAIQGSEEVVTVAAQQKMEFNDNKARVLMLSVCDMSVGSYHRVLSDVQRQSIDTLCGGKFQRPVTAEDVKILKEFYDLVRPPQ